MQNRENTFETTGKEFSATGWADRGYMARALDLAWLAAGRTDPNPLVGAVVVNAGEVVGEGYHRRCGEAHAEVVALDRAGERARGGTLYVSLEPCVHHGRTPPCVDRIIAAGVGRVVIPALDPDKKVCGKGVAALLVAGVGVDTGCLEESAIAVNLDYYKQRLGLGPTVILKMAMTMDGKIASIPGRRDEITGNAAREYVHRLRAKSDGVVVGAGTVRTDNPSLDCRLVECERQPAPVVLDGQLGIPADNRWASQGSPFVVVGGELAQTDKKAAIEAAGGRVVGCTTDNDGAVDVVVAVNRLSEIGLERLLVEGGARVFSSFMNAGVWDAMFLFQSSKLFGVDGVPVYSSGAAMSPDLVAVDSLRLDGDFLHRYLNRRTIEEIRTRLTSSSGGN